MPTHPIDAVLDELRNGMPIMLTGAEEACIVVPAQFVTPALMAGADGPATAQLSLALTAARAQQLRDAGTDTLSGHGAACRMPPGAGIGTAEAKRARDRARAVAAAVNPSGTLDDLGRDGLVVPVIVRQGGVLVRPALAEAAVDLVQLAGLMPAAAIWPAAPPEPGQAGPASALKTASIAALIAHRRANERLVACVTRAPFACHYGQDFEIRVYRDTVDGAEHVALVRGAWGNGDTVMVRIHQLDPTADLLQFRAAHPNYVEHALRQLAAHDGPAVGVFLQDSDPCSASSLIIGGRREHAERKRDRDYGLAALILQDLGVSRVALLTSSQRKIDAVEGFGLDIARCIAMAR